MTARSASILALLLCAVSACSVDANSNAAYGKSCATGSAEYKGFCVDAGARDPAAPDLGSPDAANASPSGNGAPLAPGADAATADNAAVDSQNPSAPDAANDRDASVTSTPPDVPGQPCSAQPEVCNNADDDCDGRVDENADVVCADGNAGCSPGADGTFVCMGTCRTGVKHCERGVLQSECGHQVLPKNNEMCGAKLAVDDDCDGATDEACTCKEGASQQCYNGPAETKDVGICKHGNQICNNGAFGACMGEVLPVAETCMNEGADNDCNKVVDDVPMRGDACSTSAMGRCHSGTMQCEGGEIRCRAPSPGAETCNMLDDNCDGAVDDGLLETDPNNCGSCGHRCTAEELCCSGNCVSKVANDHCGSCMNVCSGIQICCPSGTCGILDALGICL